MPRLPDPPDFDAQQVVGMRVDDATALLKANGFTIVEVYAADGRHALTLEINPRRRRLFERDGTVVRVIP